MKKLIFSVMLFLFYGFTSTAQTYTKKYNSINGRYEYHNSNGTLVAYEVYNSIYNRWDYYTVNNDNNPYNRKPIEVAPVQSNVNLELIDRVMAKKQSNYDNNVQTIQNTINTLSNKINNLNISSELKESIHDDFDRVLNVLNTNKYDYSSNSTTNDIVNWLYNEYNRIIKKASEKSTTGKYVKIKGDFTIWDSPNFSIGEPKLEAKDVEVYVVKKVNDTFYEIRFGNITGYITHAVLQR